MQVVGEFEQNVHGMEQDLHVLSEMSPYSPFGQSFKQDDPFRKKLAKHVVQEEADVQNSHGDVQILHVESEPSGQYPFGQESMHAFELKNFGVEHPVQKVDDPLKRKLIFNANFINKSVFKMQACRVFIVILL